MAIVEVEGVDQSDGEVFKVLEPGIYPAEITSCKFKKIEKEGSDYKGATMLLYSVNAEGPDANGEHIEATANGSIILPWPAAMDAEKIRKSKASVKKLQIACGLEDMGNAIDDEAFLHAELQVVLSIEESEEYGKQNRIKDVMPR